MQGFQLTQLDEVLMERLQQPGGMSGQLMITSAGIVFLGRGGVSTHVLAKRVERKPKATVKADAKTMEALRQLRDEKDSNLFISTRDVPQITLTPDGAPQVGYAGRALTTEQAVGMAEDTLHAAEDGGGARLV